MITRFRTLFTVRVSHNYYGGICRDFQFILPDDAAQTLKGGKCMAKEIEGIYHVIFEANEYGQPLASLAGQKLRLGLRLSNPWFSNFTDLGNDSVSWIRLYRNNLQYDTLGSAELVSPAGATLVHPMGTSIRPVAATLEDAAGFPLQTKSVADTEMTRVEFDVSIYHPGLFTVRESKGTDGPWSSSYYSDPGLIRMGACAILEIDIDERFYSEGVPDFEIRFEAKQEYLSYQVIARNYGSTEFGSLEVIDAGFGDDDRPEITFSATDVFAGDDPADRIVVFASDLPVARQEKGRMKIQLMKGGEPLIHHLPQPGPAMADATMIIHIAKSM